MAHVKISGHNRWSGEKEWEIATDLKRLPQWHTQVVEVKDAVGGAGQLGATATLMLKGPDRVHEVRVEVVEVEPQRVWKNVGHEVGGGMSYTSISRYSAAADGGTDWEWEQEIEPPKGLIGAFADRLFLQRTIEREMRHSVDNLDALIEAELAQPV
jgi:predicted RNA methylase